MGFCIAACTEFRVVATIAECVESVFADTLSNTIQCQWCCVSSWRVCGRLGRLSD